MSTAEPLFAAARAQFHAGLLRDHILTVDGRGVASNADSGSRASCAYAAHLARALQVETGQSRLAGQTSGGGFEQACADFLNETFPALHHLRPGDWTIQKVGGRGEAAGVARFEQYAHLVELTEAVRHNPALRAVLGNG